MFGMGFTEILLIAVIAILFLGPDKLPSAMVDIAKFFRTAKNTIGSVKDTFEEEINMSDIKKEALAYKKELEDASSQLSNATDINNILDEDTQDVPPPSATKEEKEVTFKKKNKPVKKEENVDV